ncbi:MAG: arginine deiminase family protein [Anaerolineae bacterium]|nr:arginine deiminase family protein [Anaerolineae bacterium]
MPLRADESAFAEASSFEEQMPRLWGDWGCSSEVGRLRAVLLHRPGPELESVDDPPEWLFAERMDLERARAQHDALADLYRANGVRVYYIEEVPPDKPNALFARDLVAMTPEGAIVARMGTSVRRGEERYAAEALARLGVPIVRTITGTATFEGADLMWANRDLAFVSISRRTNLEGAEMVAAELRRMGVGEVVFVHVPYAEGHLDGFMNFVTRDTAIVFPVQVPYTVVDALRRHGYRIIEVESIHEIRYGCGLNFVALEPGRLVVPACGNVEILGKLRAAGVECLEVEVDEIIKGGGSVHCMTAFLKRDEC